jgi:hypothetical protein
VSRGEPVLQFVVGNDAALLEVDEQHLSRLEPPLLDDLLFRHRQHPASDAMMTMSSSVTM